MMLKTDLKSCYFAVVVCKSSSLNSQDGRTIQELAVRIKLVAGCDVCYGRTSSLSLTFALLPAPARATNTAVRFQPNTKCAVLSDRVFKSRHSGNFLAALPSPSNEAARTTLPGRPWVVLQPVTNICEPLAWECCA
jgi:hypothetical protein